jgi:hypothetical protein
LEWSCQTSKFKKASSLFTHAKAWRMAIIQYTRAPVDPAVKMDMKNVRNHVPVFVVSSPSTYSDFFSSLWPLLSSSHYSSPVPIQAPHESDYRVSTQAPSVLLGPEVHSGSEGAHCSLRRHLFWLQESRHCADRRSLKEVTSGHRKGPILMPRPTPCWTLMGSPKGPIAIH